MSRGMNLLKFLTLDLCLVCIAIYLAFCLRLDFNIVHPFLHSMLYVMICQMILTLSLFYYFKVYKVIWRYSDVKDILAIVKGSASSILVFYIFHQTVTKLFNIGIIVPRSIYLLVPLLTIALVGASRLLSRIIEDDPKPMQAYHRKTLIVGAGDAGILVVKELKSANSFLYPLAFIDDNTKKLHLNILGIPVAGTRNDINKISKKYGIEEIIIAMPSAPKSEIAEIINIAKATGANIKILPLVNDLIEGKVSVNMIRNVSVEDLLGREPIRVNLDEMSVYLKGKTVLVTGAGGSIGSELCRQIATFSPIKLLLLGHGENSIYDIELELKQKYKLLDIEAFIADIQDFDRMSKIFKDCKPQIVFHAAAHKHVPLMEHNPGEAIKNNVLGTRNVALCSHANEVETFVMISTDKAVNPTNVMGATKRLAEMIVQSMDSDSKTKFVAVRFGNVLGSRGSVIPIFKRQIEQGGPVTVTHPDMVRYFMTIPEAVQLVIQTGAFANGGEIFILDMGKPVKIADLARDLIRLSGLEPDKDIKISYTGIRPGEKLFEEILTREEGAKATKHDRIFVGQPILINKSTLNTCINKLEFMVSENSTTTSAELKELLSQAVPTYVYKAGGNVKEKNEAFKASLELVATLNND